MFKRRHVRLDLSEEDAIILHDALGLHLEGLQEAKATTTLDPSIESAEQLLDYTAGLDHEIRTIENVKRMIDERRH